VTISGAYARTEAVPSWRSLISAQQQRGRVVAVVLIRFIAVHLLVSGHEKLPIGGH
jgi:hypothetical protein